MVPEAPYKALLDTGGVAFPTVTGTLYAPPTSGNAAALIECVVFANAAAVTRTISVYNVPPGGAPAQANILVPAVAMPANTTWAWTPGKGVPVFQGWTVQGVVSAGTDVTFTPYGTLVQ